MCRTTPAWPVQGRGGAGFVGHHHLPMHDRGPGWRRSCVAGCAGAALVHPETQHTRQTQCDTCRTAPAWPLVALVRPGEAGYVDDHHPPHARSRPRLAVLMRAGCVRGRLLCSRHLACAPEGTSHVSYNPTSASPEHADKRKRALPPPHAATYPRATVRAAGGAHAAGGVRERLCHAPRPIHAPQTVGHVLYHPMAASDGTGKAVGAASSTQHHPPPHDRARGWRRSCSWGCAGAALTHLGGSLDKIRARIRGLRPQVTPRRTRLPSRHRLFSY